jgi:glycosyltransferase involved in cell wall biosynthesis
LGKRLRLPAAGWATGGDVRVDPTGPAGRAVGRTLRNLDLVFYQSRELLGIAANLLGVAERDLDSRRHVVLARGICAPPTRNWQEARSRIRARLGLAEDRTVVLCLGRIEKAKGVYELLTVASRLADPAGDLRFVLVGATPGFDESEGVSRAIQAHPALRSCVQLLPACSPDEVWEHLAAADIFAFASHGEGMPNSVLEAMAMELPVVAFAIPAVVELDGGAEVVAKCPPLDTDAFAESIKRLAAVAEERRWRGRDGRAIVHSRFLIERSMTLAVERLEERIPSARLNAARRAASAPQAG